MPMAPVVPVMPVVAPADVATAIVEGTTAVDNAMATVDPGNSVIAMAMPSERRSGREHKSGSE